MRRILFVALGLAALTLPALAAPRDDVLFGISRCGGIADDRTWLDCVYGAAQPMRSKLGLPPAPASQQALVPPPIPGQAAPQAQAMAAPAMTPEQQSDFEAFKQLAPASRILLKLATPKVRANRAGHHPENLQVRRGRLFHRHLGQWRNLAAGFQRHALRPLEQGRRDLFGADYTLFDPDRPKAEGGQADLPGEPAQKLDRIVLGHEVAWGHFFQNRPVLLRLGIEGPL